MISRHGTLSYSSLPDHVRMTAPARSRRLSGGMENNLYTAVLLFLEGVVEVRTFFEMCTAMGNQEGRTNFSLPESDWLAAPYSALHVFARCETSVPSHSCHSNRAPSWECPSCVQFRAKNNNHTSMFHFSGGMPDNKRRFCARNWRPDNAIDSPPMWDNQSEFQ